MRDSALASMPISSRPRAAKPGASISPRLMPAASAEI